MEEPQTPEKPAPIIFKVELRDDERAEPILHHTCQVCQAVTQTKRSQLNVWPAFNGMWMLAVAARCRSCGTPIFVAEQACVAMFPPNVAIGVFMASRLGSAENEKGKVWIGAELGKFNGFLPVNYNPDNWK